MQLAMPPYLAWGQTADDKQDVEAPSCETLPQGRDRLRFDDVKGFDLQLAVKSRLVVEVCRSVCPSVRGAGSPLRTKPEP